MSESTEVGPARAPANQETDDSILLDVRNLHTHFFTEQGIVRALNGVDFTVHNGQTIGLVGESGCGKSVTARSILQIVPPPGHVVDGEIWFRHHTTKNGQSGSQSSELIDLAQLDPMGKRIRSIRGGEISMVFQEPMTSFSPVHTIGNQIMEAILLHQDVDKTGARKHAIEVLRRVNMPEPESVIDRYPHQLSGGMRQRAMIAVALSCQPSLLIADEPTTALDVTTQAQILTLMRDLQNELSMAIIFITHDLGVIAQMVDFVVVMYLGKIVESAEVEKIFQSPKHPYTQALLRSIPRLGMKSAEGHTGDLAAIPGSVPDPYSVPKGCPFHPRCHFAVRGHCDEMEPDLIEVEPDHKVSCLLYQG